MFVNLKRITLYELNSKLASRNAKKTTVSAI
jgi:hypothetical protein